MNEKGIGENPEEAFGLRSLPDISQYDLDGSAVVASGLFGPWLEQHLSEKNNGRVGLIPGADYPDLRQHPDLQCPIPDLRRIQCIDLFSVSARLSGERYRDDMPHRIEDPNLQAFLGFARESVKGGHLEMLLKSRGTSGVIYPSFDNNLTEVRRNFLDILPLGVSGKPDLIGLARQCNTPMPPLLEEIMKITKWYYRGQNKDVDFGLGMVRQVSYDCPIGKNGKVGASLGRKVLATMFPSMMMEDHPVAYPLIVRVPQLEGRKR